MARQRPAQSSGGLHPATSNPAETPARESQSSGGLHPAASKRVEKLMAAERVHRKTEFSEGYGTEEPSTHAMPQYSAAPKSCSQHCSVCIVKRDLRMMGPCGRCRRLACRDKGCVVLTPGGLRCTPCSDLTVPEWSETAASNEAGSSVIHHL